MLRLSYIDQVIRMALEEDMNYGDITTDTLIDSKQSSKGVMRAKEKGIIAGIHIAKRVFEYLDHSISFTVYKNDGDEVEEGEIIAKVQGSTNAILKGERTALNLLQRLSGIATITDTFVRELEGTDARIVDTRKTTAGLRAMEKYAVRVGGGYNHRFNLSDAVMIKDNHIQAVGSIGEAVQCARRTIPHTMKIEVEVETIEQLKEALEVKADIIMLDNMSLEMMRQAVDITNKRAILEASGNVSLQTVKAIAQTGVDIISCGALTHSVKALDISLKF